MTLLYVLRCCKDPELHRLAETPLEGWKLPSWHAGIDKDMGLNEFSLGCGSGGK